MRTALTIGLAVVSPWWLGVQAGAAQPATQPNPTFAEPLPVRGLSEPMPLWLGSSLYDSAWQRFEQAEANPAGPWFDRGRWRATFRQMSEQMLNAILLTHPHPYAGLLPLDDYPGACYFHPAELAKHVEQFRWILAEARQRRIKVYLLTWNICLPPDWARANGLSEFGSDTPLARAYTRGAVIELFRTYPDLAGLATMAGESPPGCTDFVVHAIADTFKELHATIPEDASRPELIFWTWCSYPEDARKVIDAYPPTRLLHYLQYEQWFKPVVDPRVARFRDAVARIDPPLNDVPMMTLGGAKSSLGYLLWSDPEWIRTLTLDLRQQGTDGLFFEPYCGDAPLVSEALGFYGLNAGRRYSPRPWAERLDEIYGAGEYSPRLLEALQHASAIVPRFLTLVHSQSDHHMPQFGLPLTHYLNMPTLTSYVFENTQAIDDNGYLTPRLGLAWPNPDWGERVASIRQEVTGTARPGSILPTEIAGEIDQHVSKCRSLLNRLDTVKPDDPDQVRRLTTLIDRIRLNLALGEHFYHKIQAALAWQRILDDRASIVDCTRPLELSVGAWEDVVELADRLYPGPVGYWQSQMVSPPPWTQDQIWQSYRFVKGHWRDQLPRFGRELDYVRAMLSTRRDDPTLPLWDALDATAPDNLDSWLRIGFETSPDPRWTIAEAARVITDRNRRITGNTSLLIDTRRLDKGPRVVMTTVPAAAPLETFRPYEVSLAYRVIAGGSPDTPTFEVGVRRADGSSPVGRHRFWNAPTGYVGSRGIIKIPPLEHEDYVLFIAVHDKAAIVIDQIDVQTLLSY